MGTRYCRGIGKGRGGTGTFVWDRKERKFVKISDSPPNVTGKICIEGEPVVCDTNGETLDFGVGDQVRVESAQEKHKALKKRGLMPSPTGMKNKKPDSSGIPSFGEYFHKEHGMPLKEATGLVGG
jgi:hypothetical protein